ncbi:MAG: hypothetical protein GY801_24605 [bacterium]|nr:hypothetical protein [bacterium]
MSVANSPYRTQVLQELEQIPEEYLASLLKMIRVFHESIILKPADESFRQGWQEVLNDETRPVAELWEDIDAE